MKVDCKKQCHFYKFLIINIFYRYLIKSCIEIEHMNVRFCSGGRTHIQSVRQVFYGNSVCNPHFISIKKPPQTGKAF
jgi:hypothetical protein